MTLSNEGALVARAQVEPAAFAAIYDHYFSRVYNYVRYRVSDPVTADDITSQVFERVLKNLARYDPERAPFGAWLFAIAGNIVTDYFRRQQRRQWLSLDVLLNRDSGEPLPEQQIATNERHRQVLAAMDHLSERERHLIALKYGADLSYQDIAHMTDLSESNVGVILHRALKQLRTLLAQEDYHD